MHAPDLTRIPESLRGLNWLPMSAGREWPDGQLLLAAVTVRTQPDCEPWRYELAIVRIDADVDYLRVTLDGEAWGWDLTDVDFFVEVSP